MLRELKDRILDDLRTVAAARDVNDLYRGASHPEKFHDAMADADFEEAANYHERSAEELRTQMESLMRTSEYLAEEYPELADADREEFIEA